MDTFEEDGIHYWDYYITRESLQEQMSALWGCDLKWLPTRFYFFLSDDKNLKRIYFGEYLDKVYNIFFLSEKRQK